MCEAADAYRVPVKLKNGKTAERGLRGDAVIGWAAILKPPPEMVAELGMDSKAIKRFCADGFMALGKIEPRLFRKANIEALAGHGDEEMLHYHYVGTSKDKAGKYCGNLIDARLCVRINEQFPAIMRGMGWPIDDLDLTDWERMGDQREILPDGRKGKKILDADGKPIPIDAAYRAERTAKLKRQGRSVTDYGKSRAENAGRVATKIVTDAKDEAQGVRADADEYSRMVRGKADQERAQAKQDAEAARKEAEQSRLAKAQADQDMAAVQLQVAALQAELEKARADRDAAKEDAQKAVNDAKATRNKAALDARQVRQEARMEAASLKQTGYDDGYEEGEKAAKETVMEDFKRSKLGELLGSQITRDVRDVLEAGLSPDLVKLLPGE